MNDNTQLWDRLFKTDPAATKPFTRAGGFKGTAIKPYWCIMRATQEFGPVGSGWGWTVHEDKVVDGPGGTSIWFSKVSVWYFLGGQRRETGAQWGATELVTKRGTGLFFDEEAAKKSVTDAMTKCLSYLGLAGDVHMGMFDDSKYVAALADEGKAQAKEREATRAKAAAPEAPKTNGLWLNDGGAGSTHGSVSAYLDALEGLLSRADDPAAMFDLNEPTLQEQQAKAAKAKDNPAAKAIVTRIGDIFTKIHQGNIPGKQAAE